MKFIPLFDKIIVKEKRKTENKTKSGIILPTSVKEQPVEGEVVAVGLGGKLDGNEIEMQIDIGDIVLFQRYSASEFYFNNEDYLVLRQVDVLCKLNKKEEKGVENG